MSITLTNYSQHEGFHLVSEIFKIGNEFCHHKQRALNLPEHKLLTKVTMTLQTTKKQQFACIRKRLNENALSVVLGWTHTFCFI